MQTKVLFFYAKLRNQDTHLFIHPRRPRGSQSGREKRRDESFQVRAEEPLGTDSHRTISKSSSRCRLLLCIIVPNRWAHLLSSFRVFVHDGYCTACRGHAPKKCTQSGNFQFDIDFPYDFKILSARKLKTLFQKKKLQLIIGIHACIGHVLRKYTYREYLKDTTRETSHGKVNLYF